MTHTSQHEQHWLWPPAGTPKITILRAVYLRLSQRDNYRTHTHLIEDDQISDFDHLRHLRVTIFGGCVWDASICVRMASAATSMTKIAQYFGLFDRREATLNLRVEGSIPSWLTT
jgi:hypothetical protein